MDFDIDDDNLLFDGEDEAASVADGQPDMPSYAMGMREVLCNILRHVESLTLDEILARAVQDGVILTDTLGEEVKGVLQRTPSRFDWQWRHAVARYFLLPGTGISVDTATNYALRNWMPSVASAICGESLRQPIDIAIPCIRMNGFMRLTCNSFLTRQARPCMLGVPRVVAPADKQASRIY